MRVSPIAVALIILVLGAVASIGLVTAGALSDSTTPDTTLERHAPLDSNPALDPTPHSHNHSSPKACPARAAESEYEAVSADQPRIVELYPNPTTHQNVGEFLTLELPTETRLANWTVTDGHTTASVPNETISGTVALSTDPEVTEAKTDEQVLELEGHLRLSAEGDDLELRDGNRTVDRVSYDRAPLATVWYRSDETSESVETDRAGNTDGESGTNAVTGDGQWWPREASCFPIMAADTEEATAFVLPDSPEIPLETLESANDRIRLAGYTITSEEVVTALAAAADRGVDVEVLLEAGPVGGTPETSDEVLTSLEERGVSVRTLGGEGARYRYHHPKYAVADDTVLVASENWDPSGMGGASSRGWGIRLDDSALADDLESVFAADAEGWDTEPWKTHRENATFVEDDLPDAEFPPTHDAETVPIDGAELVLAPENADVRLRELLVDADESILIKQPTIAADVSVLEESLDASRRGVDVRILLDSTWYVEDENEALAADLEAVAAEEGLPLEVSLVDPGDRFEKIHAKGVVIDGETAVVGSANWNANSLENNREVLIVVHGESAAGFYADVFEEDWNGSAWSLPLSAVAIVVIGLAGAMIVARRYVTFSPQKRGGRASVARGAANGTETASIPGENAYGRSTGENGDERPTETLEDENTSRPDTDSSGNPDSSGDQRDEVRTET